MKSLLFLSWLAFAGAGYYAYGFYNDTIAKQAQADEAAASNLAKINDLKTQVRQLTANFADLNLQLEEQTKENAELRGKLGLTQASSRVTFIAPVSATAPTAPATATAIPFPSTITTISGTTYQDCKFDRATPEGISFFHSTGVAHVPFTDLDPALAASFGYNSQRAADYTKAQQSDTQGTADGAASTNATSNGAASTTSNSPSSSSNTSTASDASKVLKGL